MKLYPHMYQINMSYVNVPSFLRKTEKKKPNIYTICSPPSTPNTPGQTGQGGEKSFADFNKSFDKSMHKPTVFKKIDRVFHRQNPLDTSISGYSRMTQYNPESDNYSRR